jgi:hypothetical protein
MSPKQVEPQRQRFSGAPRPGRKPNRRMPPRQCPISESESIEVHKIWKDRRGNALVFSLKSYQRGAFFDDRIFFTDNAGILRPSAKGITAPPNKLTEIARALTKAVETARELGLLNVEGDE